MTKALASIEALNQIFNTPGLEEFQSSMLELGELHKVVKTVIECGVPLYLVAIMGVKTIPHATMDTREEFIYRCRDVMKSFCEAFPRGHAIYALLRGISLVRFFRMYYSHYPHPSYKWKEGDVLLALSIAKSKGSIKRFIWMCDIIDTYHDKLDDEHEYDSYIENVRELWWEYQ